jgi:5-methylcytosine-specific restriction protein B
VNPNSDGKATAVERFELVTFHPSFSYEDFVEGLRPVEVERDDGTRAIEIKPRDGALKRICKRAKLDPDNRYALIIDEINRGNIAKIFGELITLVEPDKRVRYDSSGRRIAGLEVTLPCTGEQFGVPDNVDLYGTMNTSDRSIALVDLALRRRFLFRAVLPKPGVILGGDGNGLIDADDDNAAIDLRRLLRVMNARLTVLRGPDSCIGHAYFTAIEDIDGLRAAFRDRIIPLLQEYFFDDLEGVSRVLTVKKGATPFIKTFVPQVAVLFGSATEIDDLDEQRVWRVSDSMPAGSFRALYEDIPDSALQNI